MNAATAAYGPAFGIGILAPVTLLLLLPAIVAVRRAGSLPAGFLVAALWLRYAAGAFHVYMFKPVAAGLSGNALLSIAITGFGLLFVVRPANLAMRRLLPVYLLVALALVSAALNGDAAGGINAAVKYAYLVVVALATYQALRIDPAERVFGWLLIAFMPLLVFQALSLVLGLPKGSEDGDGLVWIGGYNHEGAFSVALFTGFLVACFARAAATPIRLAFVVATLVGVLLAGYRTTILALTPLAVASFWVGMGGSVKKDQRAFVATAGFVIALVSLAIGALLYADKFADLATFLADPGALLKPPREFNAIERNVMSGRPLIWSGYLYVWADGSALQWLIGFGPESWEGLFKVYPHNTLVGTLYELGLFGLGAMVLLWTVMFRAAFNASGQRMTLVAAHTGFLLLNMATMPFWQVEGLALYGLLCGYTMQRADGPYQAKGTGR